MKRIRKIAFICAIAASSNIAPITYADEIERLSADARRAHEVAEKVAASYQQRDFAAVDEVTIEFCGATQVSAEKADAIISYNLEPVEDKEQGFTLLRDETPLKMFHAEVRKHSTVCYVQPGQPQEQLLEYTDRWIKDLSDEGSTKKVFFEFRSEKPLVAFITFNKDQVGSGEKLTAQVTIKGSFASGAEPVWLGNYLRAVLQKDSASGMSATTVMAALGVVGVAGLGFIYRNEIVDWAFAAVNKVRGCFGSSTTP